MAFDENEFEEEVSIEAENRDTQRNNAPSPQKPLKVKADIRREEELNISPDDGKSDNSASSQAGQNKENGGNEDSAIGKDSGDSQKSEKQNKDKKAEGGNEETDGEGDEDAEKGEDSQNDSDSEEVTGGDEENPNGEDDNGGDSNDENGDGEGDESSGNGEDENSADGEGDNQGGENQPAGESKDGEDLSDLDGQDKQAAEDRAFEQNPHGTGVDPDMPQEYDYDASPEATNETAAGDNGMSDDFTKDSSTDEYSSQFGAKEDDSEQTPQQREQEQDEYGDQEENSGDEEKEGQDEKPQEANSEKPEDSQHQTLDLRKKKKEEGETKKLWAPGERITLRILNIIWKAGLENPFIHSLMSTANVAAKALLFSYSAGSNITLNLLTKMKFALGGKDDIIGTILEITSNESNKINSILLSVGQAFITQSWTEPLIIATLGKTMESIINMNPLYDIFSKMIHILVDTSPSFVKVLMKALLKS